MIKPVLASSIEAGRGTGRCLPHGACRFIDGVKKILRSGAGGRWREVRYFRLCILIGHCGILKARWSERGCHEKLGHGARLNTSAGSNERETIYLSRTTIGCLHYNCNAFLPLSVPESTTKRSCLFSPAQYRFTM